MDKNLTPLLQKCEEKKQDSTLRHGNIFNIKKRLVLVLKTIVHVLFYVFQTNLNKAVDVLCKL